MANVTQRYRVTAPVTKPPYKTTFRSNKGGSKISDRRWHIINHRAYPMSQKFATLQFLLQVLKFSQTPRFWLYTKYQPPEELA